MIWICVPSRDGKIQDDVLIKVNAAAGFAQARGLATEMSIVKYPYAVSACRNQAVHQFLRADNYDRILFVDDDVLLPANAIVELASIDADIAMGCYASVRYDTTGGFKTFVAIRRRDEDWREDWFDGVVDADAGGTGCMMVRRHVFDKVGFPWFRWKETWTSKKIELQSEDCEFCERAQAVGMRIKAHGGIRCGHIKTIDVSRLIGGK